MFKIIIMALLIFIDIFGILNIKKQQKKIYMMILTKQ